MLTKRWHRACVILGFGGVGMVISACTAQEVGPTPSSPIESPQQGPEFGDKVAIEGAIYEDGTLSLTFVDGLCNGRFDYEIESTSTTATIVVTVLHYDRGADCEGGLSLSLDLEALELIDGSTGQEVRVVER